MSGSWIAGGVRARLLAGERILGRDAAAEIAAAPSYHDALVMLTHTPYRRELEAGLDLADAQRAVAAKALLDVRLLAGWLPGDALGLLRALCGWYELANLEDRIAYLGGATFRAPFELGSLAVAWPRADAAMSLVELRRALAASSWGDPGGDTPAEVGLGLRLAWARRVANEAPEARPWAAGAAALLLARELFVVGMPVELLPLPAFRLLGDGWRSAATFGRFVEELPPDSAWAFAGANGPEHLWRAEAAWWRRCERDAHSFVHAGVGDPMVVTGAVGLLAVDARRVRLALEVAYRRNLPGVQEVLDAAV